MQAGDRSLQNIERAVELWSADGQGRTQGDYVAAAELEAQPRLETAIEQSLGRRDAVGLAALADLDAEIEAQSAHIADPAMAPGHHRETLQPVPPEIACGV